MQILKKVSLIAFSFFALSNMAMAQTAAPENARAYFINLQDGDTVQSPFLVQFGLSGMGIAPAGIEKENTGHHHLLIDRPALGEAADGAEELEYAIGNDDHHKHFGKGQTETTLTLPAGKHTLQMVLGDWSHVPHVKPVASERITITVK